MYESMKKKTKIFAIRRFSCVCTVLWFSKLLSARASCMQWGRARGVSMVSRQAADEALGPSVRSAP